MDHLNSIIAENLKRIREERKLSLDTVARLSGVSKSMLGQIERSEVNPTVSTVWKIANGLKISFTSMMSRPERDIELVPRDQVLSFIEDEGRFRNYAMFPFDETRRFEMYMVEVDPGGSLAAEGHLPGSQEFITVSQGVITVGVGDAEYVVEQGNALRFKADMPHSYRNTGEGTVLLSMVIYYS